MFDIFADISPILLLFLVGIVGRKFKILDTNTADVFIKFIFYVTLPALVINSVYDIEFDASHIFLPLTAVSVMVTTTLIGFLFTRIKKLERKTLGTFIIGSMIINLGFMMPFIKTVFGEEGLSLLFIFDLGNSLIIFSLGYYLASRFGEGEQSGGLKKLFGTPPFIAFAIALLLNYFNIGLPTFVDNFTSQLGHITLPLIIVSLGIYFNPRAERLGIIGITMFIRTVIGGLAGYFFAGLFGLEGLSYQVAVACCAAPVGYNTLTFSTIEKLDKRFASSLVSISIFISLFLTPVVIFLVK